MSIKIALADDHSLFRKTLASYLSQQKSIDILFEVSNAFELINWLKRKPVDIIVIDLFMPHLNGTDAISIIRNEYPEIKIIVLSMCTDIQIITNLLDIGIHGYITKADDPEELLKAIKSASENRIYRNKVFTEALYWGTQNNMTATHNNIKINFNDREKTIIQLLWEEKNNKDIANHLFLSVRSIEKIRQELKEKIGVKTTVGILKYALSKKLIGLTTFLDPSCEPRSVVA